MTFNGISTQWNESFGSDFIEVALFHNFTQNILFVIHLFFCQFHETIRIHV